MIKVSINNFTETFKKGSTILEAIETMGYADKAMLGVALNQTFVPKAQWSEIELKDNDQVEILNPISGG